MKFLIITRQKDSFVMLPPEMQRQLMEGQAAFIDKYRKAGKIQVIYNMPGLKGGVSIMDGESAEEGNQMWLELPIVPLSGCRDVCSLGLGCPHEGTEGSLPAAAGEEVSCPR